VLKQFICPSRFVTTDGHKLDDFTICFTSKDLHHKDHKGE